MLIFRFSKEGEGVCVAAICLGYRTGGGGVVGSEIGWRSNLGSGARTGDGVLDRKSSRILEMLVLVLLEGGGGGGGGVTGHGVNGESMFLFE